MKSTHKRYLKRRHKFGIRVPKTVEEALRIDRSTKTTFWRDAIHKEMKNNCLAFMFLEEDESVTIGYKWIKCHMIFDIKMDFTRKAWYVAGGHVTDPPSTLSYSSIVSQDSVTWSHVLIVRALYGLKSSGTVWCSHLANTLHHMGFTSSLADPDVWYKPATKPNGFQYYEYVLVFCRFYHIFGYLKYHDRPSLILCYFLSIFFYAFLFVQEHFPLFSRNHKKKHHTDIYDKNMQLHFNCLLNPILIILLQWNA